MSPPNRRVTRAESWDLPRLRAATPERKTAHCIFFGISAVAGYLVPSTGSVINLAAANLNTVLGAACFLACAIATLLTGRTLKSPRLTRLHRLEADVERDVERII